MSDIDKLYCRIPLSLIKKYSKNIPFDLYLRLSDARIVKISNKEEDIWDIVEKYRAKGVAEIYGAAEQYLSFLKSLKDQLNYKLFNPDTTIDEKVELLAAAHQVAKEALQKIGVSEMALDLAKQVADVSLQFIQTNPSLSEFFIKYRTTCGDEYTKAVMVGYINSCLLDTFDWSSELIKQKANFAILLRDILLTPTEFAELEEAEKSDNYSKLSKKVREHPVETAKVLEDTRWHSWISQDVLMIIKQHHELPDGNGFPFQLSHNKITQLASTCIIAQKFIHQLIQEDFNINTRGKTLSLISEKYSYGNFKKSIKALYQALGVDLD